MEQPALTNRRSLLRSVALLVVGALAVLASRLFWPGAQARLFVRWGDLYRRAGDTYVLLSYLVPAGEKTGFQSGSFLLLGQEQYRLSAQADPENLRTTLSDALALQALHRDKEARDLLLAALRRRPQEEARAQLRLLLAGPLAAKPDPVSLEKAYATVLELPPAPLVFSDAYRLAGQPEAATRIWHQGLSRALALRPAAYAVLIVCGLILALGAAGLIALLFFRITPRRAGPKPAAPSRDWSGRDALEALLLFVLLQLAFGVLLLRLPVPREAELYPVLGASVLAGLGAIAWVKCFAGRPTVLGWRLDHPARALLLGAVAGGATVLPALGLGLVAQHLFHLPPQEQPIVPIFASAADLPARLFLILGACVMIPALEETLFRGVLYGALRRYVPVGAAALISALIFAGGHMTLSAFLSLVLLGLVLAWLYERTGSLLAPAAAHGVFNAFSVAIMLLIYR